METERKPRPIRMDDEEWEYFRLHLGAIWLRRKIALGMTKQNRKPTAHKIEE